MELVDTPLRPSTWAEFIGQDLAKEELEVAIGGALRHNNGLGRPLGHVLLAGRPGFGKTSLAAIIASRLGDPFDEMSMATVRPYALASFFRTYPGGVVLFDEIHNADKKVKDMLLTLLEEGYITTPGGQRIEVPYFTGIVATTEPEKLTKAFKDRFEHTPRFVDYTDDEMRQIVHGLARKVPDLTLDDEAAHVLGRAAGGTPRNARRLVLKARDLAAPGRACDVDRVLRLAGVDRDGVTDDHRDYLAALDNAGGVAGLATIKMLLGSSESDIRELERFLLTRKFIVYGERGREITATGTYKARGTEPRLRRTA